MTFPRLAFACWFTLAAPGPAPAATTANVVATQVEAVARREVSERDPALLVVYVVDQDGVPLEGADVRLVGTRKPAQALKTGKDGTVLLRWNEAERVTVEASHEGCVAALARRVALKRGALTVVALPLPLEPDEP